MDSNAIKNTLQDRTKRSGRLQIVLLVVAVAMVTTVVTVWLALAYLFPREFAPVQLGEREVQALDAKLAQLDPTRKPSATTFEKQGDYQPVIRSTGETSLTPERYSEEGASRQITLSEREINGLLARNTDLANKLVIDLSKDLASAKLLIKLDPDFPFVGGKTLKVTAGLELRYAAGTPIVMLKGVSIWGVPIPNAWMGGLKNVDLVKEFGAERGFWRTFSAGVEHIRVEEGHLSITLKE